MKALGKKPPKPKYFRCLYEYKQAIHYRTTILEARERIKHIKTLPTSVKKHRALEKLWKDLGVSAGELEESKEKGD